jgi:hypothetical protein
LEQIHRSKVAFKSDHPFTLIRQMIGTSESGGLSKK